MNSLILNVVGAIAAVSLLAGAECRARAATIFTNKAQFLSASGAGPSALNGFSDLDYYGLTADPLTYQTGANPAYTISSPPFGYAFADVGAVMACDNSPGLLIQIPGGAGAIGGDIHLEDVNYMPQPARLFLDLNDGTSQQLWVTNATDFVGFMASGVLITSLLVTYPDNDWVYNPWAVLYPTLDNLYVVAGLEPRPELAIAWSNSVVIVSWPSPSTGFVLQQSVSPGYPGNWLTTVFPSTASGGRKSITLPAPTEHLFFRLFKAP